jgi:hypothetical protein
MMANSLYDEKDDVVYVPMSSDAWNKLRYGWSDPVQLRVENDELVMRALEQTGRLWASAQDKP